MNHLFKRLLLATEHTDFDTGAERLAMTLAQRNPSPLARPLPLILPLVSNPEYEALAPQIAARAERIAAEKIAQLQSAAQAAGIRLDVAVRRGEEPYLEIVQQAAALQTDLIIIRRRGKRGFLANLLVGEMVSKVVAHAPCHVLIVPREAHLWKRAVLLAAEATAQGQHMAAMAIDVAAQSQLPLHIVTAIQSEAARAQALAFGNLVVQQALQQGVVAQAEISVGNPHTEILEAARRTQADLIVLGSRNESNTPTTGSAAARRAWVGGVAQKVMGLFEHPVLVLRG